ncbi:hypothetical protein Agub_g14375, partial [Astrephomene gubernaculifera]
RIWSVDAMATPQAVTAVIRAARPDFKSRADKLVFAVHAIISVNGFSLRKVGEGVDEAAARGAASLPSEEADLAGWNPQGQQDGDPYSFLYTPEPATLPPQVQQQQQQQVPPPPPLLLLKCLRLESGIGATADVGTATPAAAAAAAGGEVLLVSLLAADNSASSTSTSSASASSASPTAPSSSSGPPVTLELPLDRYVPASPDPAAAAPAAAAPAAGGYQHLEELIGRVQGALGEVMGVQGGAKTGNNTNNNNIRGAATTATATATGAAAGRSGPQQGREDPLRLPTRGSPPPPMWGPQPVPFPVGGIGDGDLMPGGGGGGGFPGGLGGGMMGVPHPAFPGPRGAGGGMHVGPENPIFAGRLRHPPPGGPGGGLGSGGGGGGGVPGMRWDPISPEGLQGWGPDDFTAEGRLGRSEGLNDIGRPPPGRGPDWDNMFG